MTSSDAFTSVFHDSLCLSNLLPALPGGADKGTLRQLYMGYVRSLMDYTSRRRHCLGDLIPEVNVVV